MKKHTCIIRIDEIHIQVLLFSSKSTGFYREHFRGGKENPYVELYTLQPHGKTEEPFRMPERERERVFGLFSGH